MRLTPTEGVDEAEGTEDAGYVLVVHSEANVQGTAALIQDQTPRAVDRATS